MKRSALIAAAALIATTAIALSITVASGATSVRVTAKEYKFIFVPQSVRHGTVTFRITNTGKLKHDLKIAGKKSRAVNPHKTTTLTVTLRKGTYKYICTIPGHAALGMKGTLVVR